MADEVKRLGLQDVRAENGRILCRGSWADCARLNINLRCGARVIALLGQFPAQSFEELFQGVRAIAWEEFLPQDAAFPVKGYSISSQLHSVPACQSIIKKGHGGAPAGALRHRAVPGDGNEVSGALLRVQGSGVHRAGRQRRGTVQTGLPRRGCGGAPAGDAGGGAGDSQPLPGTRPLLRPLLRQRHHPYRGGAYRQEPRPGLDRRFDAQRWAFLPAEAWMDAADEAQDREFHGQYDIWGGDIDPRAVDIARDNARKAGVDDCVRFEVADAGKFHRDSPYGQLVTNPPYGERLMERQEAEQLYRTFGKAWRTLPAGWRTLVLSSHTEFERCFGRPADRKRKLYNGMIKCDVFMYGNV